MPSCRPDVIPEILYMVMDINPKTILDVGIGCGKWGMLCNEYLKYWCKTEPVIDGIEPFSAYRSAAWNVYRTVFEEKAFNLLKIFKQYDLILMIDVIEHLTREEGIQLLKAANRYIISTPAYWSAQGPMFGNDFEKHISKWTEKDFINSKIITDKLKRNHILGWK